MARLPQEYQEVEHISTPSDDSRSCKAWIDTGITKTDSNTKIIDIVKFTNTATYAQQSGNVGLNWGGYNGSCYLWHTGQSGLRLLLDATDDFHTYEIQSGNVKVDGNIVSTASFGDTNASITLFRRSDAGESTRLQYRKRTQIYQDGVLIRDYIPCYIKATGEAGYYDLVNKTFNHSGTDNFGVGNDVEFNGSITNKLTNKQVAGITNASGSPLVKMTRVDNGKYIEFGQEPVEAENEI